MSSPWTEIASDTMWAIARKPWWRTRRRGVWILYPGTIRRTKSAAISAYGSNYAGHYRRGIARAVRVSITAQEPRPRQAGEDDGAQP